MRFCCLWLVWVKTSIFRELQSADILASVTRKTRFNCASFLLYGSQLYRRHRSSSVLFQACWWHIALGRPLTLWKGNAAEETPGSFTAVTPTCSLLPCQGPRPVVLLRWRNASSPPFEPDLSPIFRWWKSSWQDILKSIREMRCHLSAANECSAASNVIWKQSCENVCVNRHGCIKPLKRNGYYMYHHVYDYKLYIVPTECIYVLFAVKT
jgi:hypothetical protein